MFRTSHRGRATILALTLAFLTLASSLPVPQAVADTPVVVCGRVANSAGWPISGATVTFTSLSSTTSPQPVLTLADGSFEVTGLFREHFYAVSVRPDPAARGYVPWTSLTDTSERVFSPAIQDDAACPSGPGVSLNHGTVTLASPGQGFLEVVVRDGAVAGTPGLAGVSVTTGLATGRTDATGHATLTCPVGSAALFAAKDQDATARLYLPSARSSVTCSDTDPQTVTLDLWRKPVVVTVEVTDASSRAPVVQADGAPSKEDGLQGATVSVARTPPPLRALDGAGPCGALGPVSELGTWVSMDDNPPYRCSATTDERGTATLALPWADSSSTTFRVAATKTSYQTLTRDAAYTAATATSASAGNAAADPAPAAQTPKAGQNAYLRFSLLPETDDVTGANVTVTQTVVDYQGNPIPGVTVQLDGPSKLTTTTDANGAFTASVVGSKYNVTLIHSAYNVRACTAWLNHDNAANADVINGTSPSYCFKLVGVDKAAVGGTAIDQLTSAPIPGVQFCASTGECGTTDANGKYAIEVTAGATVSLTPTNWTISGTTTPARDQFSTYPPASMERTKRTIFFNAKNSTTGAAISGAIVCVMGPAGNPNVIPAISQCSFPNTNPSMKTDAAGAFRVDNVYWTKRNETPSFDIGPVRLLQSGRHTPNPHYANTSTTFDVFADPLQTSLDILLAEEVAVDTTVAATDAHTGAAITGATVTAAVPTGAQPPRACGKTCSGTTPAVLPLYSDTSPGESQHTYDISAGKTNYVSRTSNANAPGSAVSLALARTTTIVSARVVDAHTGGPIRGATVTMVGDATAFDCAATGAPSETGFARVCTATTLSNGTPMSGTLPLDVPWTTAGEACFSVQAGTYTVSFANNTQAGQTFSSLHALDLAAVQETVAFQAGSSCVAVPPLPKSQSFWVNISLSRAASALAGTVVDFKGDPIEGATVTPASERPYPAFGRNPSPPNGDPLAYSPFVCDPAATSSATRFPHCAGASTTSTGAFSLSLPALASTKTSAQTANMASATPGADVPDNTWDLKVAAQGYHSARFPRNVSGSSGNNLALWPTTFTATVKFHQNDTSTTCGAGYTGNIVVTLKDLETGNEYPANAVRSGATCTATFTGVGWKRYLDGAAIEPIAKTSDVYLITTSYGGYAGAMPALLGPASTEAPEFTTRSTSTSGSTGPFIQVGYVHGTVRDLEGTSGVGPLGVTLMVTKRNGACLASGQIAGHPETTMIVGPDGTYAVPLMCAGQYDIQLSSPAYPATSKTVDFLAEGNNPEANFDLHRLTGTLTVTAQDATSSAIRPGVIIDVVSRDGSTPPLTATTGADGKATFVVPWGVYTVAARPSTGTGVTTTVVMQPGPGQTASATVLIVESPALGRTISGRVVDDDAATNVLVPVANAPLPLATGPGVPGVIVTATKQGNSCMGSAPSTFRNVTDAKGDYSITVPSGCAGNYVMTFSHPSSNAQALYEPVSSQLITYDAATGTSGVDAHLTRTRATLWMTPINATSTSLLTVPNTVLDLQGVDVGMNIPAQTWPSDPDWVLPWGFYFVVPQPPKSSPTTGPQQGTNWGVPELFFFPPGGGPWSQSNPMPCFVVYVPTQQDAQAGRV